MSASPSEDKPLLHDEDKGERATWISMALFLVLQFLIFIPGEAVMATLGVQFARSAFARERNYTLPIGVNACTSANHSHAVLTEIQSETALFSTYQSFLTDLIPVLTGLPLIAASDFTGRRPILLLRCLGPLVMAVGFLVVSFFELSVYYALIGCAVFGISGGFVLLHSISMLYVTDIVSLRQRGVALAAIYGIEYTVMYLAPLFFNLLLDTLSSYTVVYLVITCFAASAFLWMIPPGIIRESAKRQPVDLGVARGITQGIRNLFVNATEGRWWRVVVILACYAVVGFNMHGFQNTVNLYALGEPFCWTPTLIGVFAFVYGVPNAILAPCIVWFMELFVSDYWVIYLSIVSGIAEFLLTAVATTNAVLIFGASIAGVVFGISQPVYISLLTKLVARKSHGALFSVHTLVFAITAASSLIIQSFAYSLAVQSGHAVVIFYVMAVMSGLVFIPTLVVHLLQPKDGFHPDAVTELEDRQGEPKPISPYNNGESSGLVTSSH